MPNEEVYFDHVQLIDGSYAEVCDSVARAAINAVSLPSLEASVENEVLSITWTSGTITPGLGLPGTAPVDPTAP